MAAFSAEEDEALLLLVVAFQSDNGDIDWDSVLDHMAPTTRTVDDLQHRLRHLSTTDTTILHDLPEDFVAGSSLALSHRTRTPKEIYHEIDKIFSRFTKSDVRQPSGQENLNTGEISPKGVSTILEQVALTDRDIFVDIGSGIGNIIAQVVMQSPVRAAVGLEIREDLANKSREALRDASATEPRLFLAGVITGDIKSLSQADSDELKMATVVYSNNQVFKPHDNLGLVDFVCSSMEFRIILLTRRVCSRCSSTCQNAFCKQWVEDRVINAETCWSQHPARVFMYKRKPIVGENLLNLLDSM